MAGITALAGAGASIYGALSSRDTASNVQLPPQFQMPGMGQAANSALQGIQNLPGQNVGQTTVPLAQQTGLNLYNNPYAGGYQQGAAVAGGLGQAQALNQFGQGGQLGGYGQGLLPYGQALAQMGFDPQNALYNRALGQTQQQTGEYLAHTGVGNTPYGAGVMGNTLSNFNIDWQNQQLQRAIQGAQGAGQLGQYGGQAIGQGAGLQASAPGQFLTSSALPYSTYQGIGQGQLGALTGLQGVAGGAQGLAQTPIQDYLNYLGQGTQQQNANTAVARTGLEQSGLGWQQNQQLGGNLGAGIYGAGQAFNPNSSMYGGNFFGGGGGQSFPGARSLWGNITGGGQQPYMGY